MKCPSCKDVNLVMTDRNRIKIDCCTEFRGVLLERGEPDKIIRRYVPQQEKRTPEDNYQGKNYNDRDNDYRYKKKKGLLGDIFDF